MTSLVSKSILIFSMLHAGRGRVRIAVLCMMLIASLSNATLANVSLKMLPSVGRLVCSLPAIYDYNELYAFESYF